MDKRFIHKGESAIQVLILTHLATGRLAAEITALKWGDITVENERIFCQWPDRKVELPAKVYMAICDYLESASRLEHMRPEDFIFTPRTDRATRLPNVREWDRNKPLSVREVSRLLKRHAKRVGLSAKQISTRTLRYSAVMLRCEVGDDPTAVCSFLAHSHLNTTLSLLKNLEGRQALAWASVEDLLGL